MASLLVGATGQETVFRRKELKEGHSQRWLEDRLFQTPLLIPMQEIDPGAGAFVPESRRSVLKRSGVVPNAANNSTHRGCGII